MRKALAHYALCTLVSRVRGWTLVAAAAGLFAYATGMSSAAGTSGVHRHRCVPPGAHVIAQDRVLLVYSTGARSSYASGVRACLRGVSASMTLLPAASERHIHLHQAVGRFVLAGDFVGYIETQFGVDSGATRLIVVDVASRRTVHEVAAGHFVDAGFVFSESVTDFVVSNRGSVAWITERKKRGLSEEERTVQVVGPTGVAIIDDAGITIAPTSLRLSGRTLTWLDGGMRRTAPMP